jgi:prophage regulatory protein
MIHEKLLKIDQCLEIIPIAKSTWWQGVKEGKLPQPVKIGASTFWKYSDLMAFIANMPVETQPKAPAAA